MLRGIKPFPLSFLHQLAHVSSVENCSFQASVLKEIVSLSMFAHLCKHSCLMTLLNF